ncbi:hypothetical protein [Jiella pelagia]|uniref:GcrA cell cycle regulator n=1 Tax=Jiella pelagia TaxID=2986949 RepID=A0ABY7BV46_9HYPH|nr:hypothetical protein [Jiella pelagia]WAP67212.1 hypothetical protein OH818_16680 [Jiella pelagia]
MTAERRMDAWTAEELAEAAVMWARGATKSAIAAAIGRTARAVAGKIDRNRKLFAPREGMVVSRGERREVMRDGEGSARPFSETEKRRVAMLWRDGATFGRIGAGLQRDASEIRALKAREPGLFAAGRSEAVARGAPPLPCRAGRATGPARPSDPPRRGEISREDGRRLSLETRLPVTRLCERAPGNLFGGRATPLLRGAEAFAPLDGTVPTALADRRGCQWPVEMPGHSGLQLYCDAPVDRRRVESGRRCWCDRHVALEAARRGREREALQTGAAA